MKHIIRSLTILCFLAITTSCATLINGTKSEVTFRSNVESAVFDIDTGKLEVAAGNTVKLRAGFDEEMLLVRAPEYQTEVRNFESRFDWWILANNAATIGAVIGVVNLIGGDELFESPVRDYSLWVAAWSVGPILTGIDFLMGSWFRYPKEIYADLVKKPAPIDPETSHPVFVEDIEFDILMDTQVGKILKRNGSPKESIKMEYRVYYHADAMRSVLNEHLSEFGSPLPDERYSEENPWEIEGYAIQMRITDMKYIEQNTRFELNEGKCTLDCTMTLKSTESDEVVYTTKRSATATAQGNNFEAMYKASQRVLYEFLDQQEVRQAIQN